ncbi:hypothetical protein J7F01_12250 [Streptomyces sp. ISL-22]|uniref:hypothetical protein n=1 Tax=Streptomyces sp. ISL-22 TaxID=2819180 RepID=UPI001BEC05B1|nr:hypothetical protein [Streptomyces sp. ISL-22]MBT2418636.1 hypothetical protein [Streptomyces sp. ISL-24]MBT2432952.1 hypothetical protein [Streptomyces sp. ISL-22]
MTVIPGRASGALGTGSYSFSQDTSGVPGASETDDFFFGPSAVWLPVMGREVRDGACQEHG